LRSGYRNEGRPKPKKTGAIGQRMDGDKVAVESQMMRGGRGFLIWGGGKK